MTLLDYHPGRGDPGVALALVLAVLLLSVGGYLILRPSVRGSALSWRLLLTQALGLITLIVTTRLLVAATVHTAFQLSHHPQASIVCAHWIQQSPLPYLVAVVSLLLVFSIQHFRHRSELSGSS